MAQASGEIPQIVAETVSEAKDIPVEELPPISTVIDPDVLESILSSPETEPTPEVMLTFEYAGLRVFAHPGYIVDARPVRNGE